jgi:hypothetical protein
VEFETPAHRTAVDLPSGTYPEQSRLRRFVSDHAVTLGVAIMPIVVGALSYSGATGYFDAFGISPSEAGLGLDALIGSVALQIVVAAIVIGFSSLGPSVGWRWFGRAFAVLLVLLLDAKRLSETPTDTSPRTSYLFLVLLAYFLGIHLLRTRGSKAWRSRAARVAWWFVVPVTAFFSYTGLSSGSLTDFSRRPQSLTASPLFGGFGPRLRFVKVVLHTTGFEKMPQLGDIEQANEEGCILSVGEGAGGRILLVAATRGSMGRILIVNSQQMSLVGTGRCAITLPNGLEVVNPEPA